MADTFRIKRRAVGGAAGAPATLAAAELAFNEQTNILYYGGGNSANQATTIFPIAGPGAFLPTTGGILTGSLTLGTNTLPQPLYLNGAATNTGRAIYWQTAGVNRWGWHTTNTAESGANLGGDLDLSPYDDTGVLIGTYALRINRSTGQINVGNGGLAFGSVLGASPSDLSSHIALWGTSYGFSVTSARLNHVGGSHFFVVAGVDAGSITSTGLNATAVGATTPSTGSFTTLAATGTVSGAGFTTLLAPYAPLASPVFSGAPSLPTGTIGVTQVAGTNSTTLATTAFVQAANAAAVLSFNTRVGAVVLTAADVTGVGGALLAGPTFTGVPAAPTAAPGTNTTQLATTGFVAAAAALYLPLTGGVISNGIQITGTTGGTGTQQLLLSSATTAYGIILNSTFTANAIRMNVNQSIGFIATANRNLYYDNVNDTPTGLKWSIGGQAAPNPVITLADAGYIQCLSYYADGATGSWRSFRALTSGILNWVVGGNLTATPQDGSNAGTDFDFNAYSDTGALIATHARITRATGLFTFYRGIFINTQVAPGGITDLSRHIALYSTTYGFNVTANRLNYLAPNLAAHTFVVNTIDVGNFSSTGLNAAAVGATTPSSGAFTTLSATGAVSGAGFTTLLAPYAPLASPVFTGAPSLPTGAVGITQVAGTNNTTLATTAFVTAADIAAAGVVSFNTRAGAVVLTAADVTGVGGALLASPSFSGVPLAPTAAALTNTTQISTTAFVQTALSSYAPLASPTFTGTVTLPTGTVGVTQAIGDEDTSIATVNFVAREAGGFFANNIGDADATWTTAQTNGRVVQAAGTLTADRTVTLPVNAAHKTWVLRNGTTGGFNVTFAAGSNNFTIPPNYAMEVFSSGTALFLAQNMFGNAIRIGDPIHNAFTFTAGATSAAASILTTTGTGAIQITGAFTAPTPATADNTTTVATTAFVKAQLYATLLSPALTGTPTAPTAAALTNTTQLATCAFVTAADIASAGVSTFNTRAGAVVLTAADVTGVGGALLAGPTFTGVPAAPTAAANTNTTQIATTAFVLAAAAAYVPLIGGVNITGGVTFTAAGYALNVTNNCLVSGILAVGGTASISNTGLNGAAVGATTPSTGAFTTLSATGAVSGAGFTTLLAAYAPLASPVFTGAPSLPTGAIGVTQVAGTSSTTLATTAFVTTADNLKAPLASPALTGTPTAPTAAVGTATTQLATTAFVTGAAGGGGPSAGNRNRLINSSFRVNQRGSPSPVNNGAGYSFVSSLDMWRSGVNGHSWTFNVTNPAATITISSGSVQQIIEGALIEGGTYTLSWQGTATGRINAGTYAASPITVTGLAAAVNLIVEFQAGTVLKPQLEPGTVATQWEMRLDEKTLCERYYQQGSFLYAGYGTAGMAFATTISLPTSMRVTPSITVLQNSSNNLSGFSQSMPDTHDLIIQANVTAAASFNYNGSYYLFAEITSPT